MRNALTNMKQFAKDVKQIHWVKPGEAVKQFLIVVGIIGTASAVIGILDALFQSAHYLVKFLQ